MSRKPTRGWKAPALARPPILDPAHKPTRGPSTTPLDKIINATYPGTMHPGGAANIHGRKLGSMVPEQCHKHPQGSMQRGIAPAPTLPSTAEGTVPVATAVGTETQQP